MWIFFSKPQEMVSIEIEATQNINFRQIDSSIKQVGSWRGQRLPQSVTIQAPKDRLDEIILKLSARNEITKINDDLTASGLELQNRLRSEREEMSRRFGFGK
ncbi:MAG: hypothetical protein A3I77_00940 [Gammaproteobacteria bacterium RIFCSPLOWO2_02_FULL_42_14]|nr:MAG: hypothetical protein A3B71_04730 [Gammaproteobacteria bacterium RIFCSPHIGHO2_02_FULL_42_43]OGT60996.1 MAG: hypothetical protein A3I77_00940 [Gammaproteobacteria bacterium RIFCSPLOWO2_02_FULL_42_14]OGT85312.1 MAG: hypothetical protein A3G86_05575 [Gammaproteobacteria bacterium RIFCSPLOWO2_12_FULL_42_18]